MEVARSIPFLESMILFSLTSNFEKYLKQELWLCHKNMDISMEDLYNMTVADRKTYITIHNKQIQKDKEKLENIRRKN